MITTTTTTINEFINLSTCTLTNRWHFESSKRANNWFPERKRQREKKRKKNRTPERKKHHQEQSDKGEKKRKKETKKKRFLFSILFRIKKGINVCDWIHQRVIIKFSVKLIVVVIPDQKKLLLLLSCWIKCWFIAMISIDG